MAGIDLGDAWADGVWEDGVWADGVWEGQDDAGGTDTDVDPPHFRDAQYRRRLSWGMGCVLLLLMAGCADGVSPAATCPNVVVYLSFDSASTMTTDSIRHPRC